MKYILLILFGCMLAFPTFATDALQPDGVYQSVADVGPGVADFDTGSVAAADPGVHETALTAFNNKQCPAVGAQSSLNYQLIANTKPAKRVLAIPWC